MSQTLCCDHCNYSTNKSFNLKRHNLRNHNVNTEPDEKDVSKNLIDNDSFVRKEELNRIIKDVGWIYCITSSEKDIYKCGKLTNLCDEIESKKHLITRYGIILVNFEIIHIVNVSNSKCAEKELFKLLENINFKRELYKTLDVNYIVEKMNEIGEKYSVTDIIKNQINEYKEIAKYEKSRIQQNPSNTICDKCNISFCRLSYLKIHRENCKGKIDPLKCEYCGKIYKCRQNKSEHQKICKAKYITNNFAIDNYNFSKAPYINLTPELATEHINDGLDGFKKVIDIIYFNEDLPSLIEIYVDRSEIVKIKEYGKWLYETLSKSRDKIIDNIITQFSTLVNIDKNCNFIPDDKRRELIKKYIRNKLRHRRMIRQINDLNNSENEKNT